ncbi:GAF domain-containing protein [Neorhizobium sp. JUb45]|uniref:GAF domain-containing protein n=1 Tax=Neorhizobium sp. JUb45 TaxID=2485113 RepID=UPI0010504A7C|nr:GAF domain-containing protein [Neorhizobium sp. JUb45]TCR07058.1 two-component sensor histidine kinase [Neorhizobium sp. JUb45]
MTSERDDTRRLEALAVYDIMDTPPEPEFDDVVLLASEICQTPVSLVSLVETERQWFKARIGFDLPETPISQSVCSHALQSPDLLIIPDLTIDPRTSENTLVTQPPHIRFYAGAPLISPDGVTIGTLCVIDTEPRPQGLSLTQKRSLSALARQVVALLEMRRNSSRKDDLFRRQKRISSEVRAIAASSIAAQEAGGIGTFDIDLTTGTMKISAEGCRIFRLPVQDEYPANIIYDFILPEDRHLPSADSSRTDGTASLEASYRIRTPDEGIRWISRRAAFHRDAEGRAVRMVGTLQDVTEQRNAQARMQALIRLGDALRDTVDVQQAAFDAAELMAQALGATRAGFGMVDAEAETVMMHRDWRAPGVATLEGLHHFRDYGSFIEDLLRGETVLIGDVTTDRRTRDHFQSLLDIGIRVLVNVPIFDKGRFNLVVFVHYDQPHTWRREEIDFVRSVGDRLQAAIGRVFAEEDQDILNRELSHRLKNTLSVVQAIATQTLKTIGDRGPIESFEKRLQALSSAHDVLIHQNWTGASIRHLVSDTLDRLGMLERSELSGPNIFLGPKATQSVMLLLHELATNAVKYGGLSNGTGQVTARWEISGPAENTQLTFTWQETGGPPVVEPERRGFGSRLIRMGLLGTGGVDIRYEPPGIMVIMRASLSHLQEAG